MDVRSIAADALFRACFTACPLDPKTLLLDVRSAKVFKRKHILQVIGWHSARSTAALQRCVYLDCNVGFLYQSHS